MTYIQCGGGGSGGNANISSGTYAGDSTNNRGIPHSLGIKPKIVYIFNNVNSGVSFIGSDVGLIFFQSAGHELHTVTAKDTTNFYVGGGANFRGNHVTINPYNWIAIG